MARLLRIAAVAVLVGGATAFLTACTGDSDPVVTESPSVTAVVTPSPSPSPSVSPTPTALSDEELLELIPEDARVESFIGASNFAKFFLLEYNRMFLSGDDKLFRRLSGDDCAFCTSSLAAFEDLIGSGGRSEGGEISVAVEQATGGIREDGFWYVGVPFTAAPNSDYSAAGELIESGAGATGTAALRLEWTSLGWVVRGVEIEAA